MNQSSLTMKKLDLRSQDAAGLPEVHYQLSSNELIEVTLRRKEGVLSDRNALVIRTGRFTGRSPKDKFIVKDEFTESVVCWNEFNNPISEYLFSELYDEMISFVQENEVWMRDATLCSEPVHAVKTRVVTDTPWSNLFVYNMFLRPAPAELEDFDPDWLIIHLSSFKGVPKAGGVRSENFCIMNFSQKVILIGGTGYTGEIKKSMFTALNLILPFEKRILSMHCSANTGKNGDTALFFGLSGTGKTTLSADPDRYLIGDDEHGWSDDGIFNFEGGCYAKCINLESSKEPQIFSAIKAGALVENVTFFGNSNVIDFSGKQITENTRVSYPVSFVPNALQPSIGSHPQNLFFLTCDAYGVLPPVARLTNEQALYHFLSGYTAKIAGTEDGISEPVTTFSTCFGAPFLPLAPHIYSQLLLEKLLRFGSTVWLINTGWTGGMYGVGSRIDLIYTRNIIKAILENKLDQTAYKTEPVFGLHIPVECPGVPAGLMDPKSTWQDPSAYLEKANELAGKFALNFEKFQVQGMNEL